MQWEGKVEIRMSHRRLLQVYGDAAVMLPLIISQTFAKKFAPRS